MEKEEKKPDKMNLFMENRLGFFCLLKKRLLLSLDLFVCVCMCVCVCKSVKCLLLSLSQLIRAVVCLATIAQ